MVLPNSWTAKLRKLSSLQLAWLFMESDQNSYGFIAGDGITITTTIGGRAMKSNNKMQFSYIIMPLHVSY